MQESSVELGRDEVYEAALRLLSRREHSCWELTQKLHSACRDPVVLEAVQQRLQEQGYQSDERYAMMVLRSLYAHGSGPDKARQKLQQSRVASTLIRQVLQDFDGDWFELASQVRAKRFGTDVPEDFQERAKQMRFLAGRGFTREQIEFALGEE
jgi:regulatory protein